MKTIAVTAIAILMIPYFVVFNLRWLGITGAIFSDSEPPGLYREVHVPIERGAMVQMRQLMKHVAAVPGDTVCATPMGSFVNHRLWPNSDIPTDAKYPHYPYGCYKLAAGQYWILGSHPLSYDSRYLGMIPWDLIDGTVKPFWTKSNGYAPGTWPW